MSKTQSIIFELYDAWRAQDLDRFGNYLPDDFCHVIHIPTAIHPLGGTRTGKAPSLARLSVITNDFDFLRFDTSGIMVHQERAGVEIAICYRHRKTGASLETTIANFWTFEAGWPVRLAEYHDIDRIQAFNETLTAHASAGL